ncbi:hypothetical protein Hamer_G016098, partial [Homarus americanus]
EINSFLADEERHETLTQQTINIMVGKQKPETMVVYDDWMDLSLGSLRQEDLHAESSFSNVAASFRLSLHYVRSSSLKLYRDTEWSEYSLRGSGHLAGVVSVGECQLGTTLLTLGKRTGIPTMALDMYRRFQCVTHVLYNWLRQGRTNTTSTTTSSDPSRHTTFRKLWPTVGLLPKTSNYRQEYMNCIGPDVEISLEAAEKQENPPHDLQLVLARRFLKGRRMTVVTINGQQLACIGSVWGQMTLSANYMTRNSANMSSQECLVFVP